MVHTSSTERFADSAADETAKPHHQLTFGVMVYPDRDFSLMIERFQMAEALGFHEVYVPDHSRDLRAETGTWFEGMTALAVAAMSTTRIRIGTLVSNPILRPPAILAKQAVAIDHLSGGRLDLGIGAGVFAWDHHAVGTEPWSPKERAGRFADYVAIVDGILRGHGTPFSYEGDWLWTRDAATAPSSFQQPRVPIITGGQSPTVLRVTAKHADVWHTIGPMGVSAEEVLEVTARQNRQLDELLRENGRQPSDLRRSFATYGPWDIWTTQVSLESVVERFSAIGVSDFVFDFPEADRIPELERLARETIPALRTEIDAKR
jgi:alkanesulfonate monooxygenase SsuD/methylene tetrahydromethanopterin reductase-like flavin-dependent oxidoreductase (luciferase family)